MTFARFSLAFISAPILALAAGALPAPGAMAAEAPPTLIIFDGSGSMWGKAEGDKRSKFDVAREALRASLAKVPASVPYGLMSFGHRRGGDCSDIQLLAPVATGDITRVSGPLDKLNPRGKGPIAGAIREGAKAFSAASDGSIVLIHDNADNCRQDACEAAKDVHASHPKLKIHLVGIGLEAEDRNRMSCVAKVTGGTAFDAPDAARLQQAVGDAIRLAMSDPSMSNAPSGTASPAAAAAAQPPTPPAVPGLLLSAKLSRDAGVLDAPVRWLVRKGEATVFEGSGATVLAKLDPGSYAVAAEIGLVSAKATAEVNGSQAVPVAISFEAAALRLAVRDLKDGPISSSALVTIHRAEDAAAERRPVWIGRAAEADLVLPAGTYKLNIADGLISRDETFTAAAGAVIAKDLVTGAGRLEVSASEKPDGAPLDGVTILLARDDPEAPDGRREIARATAQRPTFIVPAGTYYVTVRSGPASVRERIAVGAGDTVKRTIALSRAKLAIAPVGVYSKASDGAARLPVKTRILSLEGPQPREVARSISATPEFSLAPGRYRIEATAGQHNARAIQDIDLEPLANRKVALKLEAQIVNLKLAGGGADITWDVRDAAGKVVARSLDPSPSLVLVPGRYQVRAEVREKSVSGLFDVASGGEAAQTVELTLK